MIGSRDKIKEIANHCICGIFPTSLNLGRQENSILLLAVFRLQCGALRLWDLGHLWKAFGRRFVVEKYRHLSLCQIAKPWLAGNLDTLGPNFSKVAIEGIKKNLKKKRGNLTKLLAFPFCQMLRFNRFMMMQPWCNTRIEGVCVPYLWFHLAVYITLDSCGIFT